MKNFHPIITASHQGFSLVEVILSAAILGMIVLGVVGSALYGETATVENGDHTRAVLLANEGIEVLRNLRDQDFDLLHDGVYGLEKTTSGWRLAQNPEQIDQYTRTVMISSIGDLYRKVTTTVAWQGIGGTPEEVHFDSTLSRWHALGQQSTGSGGGGGGSSAPTGGSGVPTFSGGADSGRTWVQRLHAKIPATDGIKDYIYGTSRLGEGTLIDVLTGWGTAVDVYSVKENGLVTGESSIDASFFGSVTITGVFATQHYLYVTTQDSKRELYIFNIDTPELPVFVGLYNISQSTTANQTTGALYVASVDRGGGDYQDTVAYVGLAYDGIPLSNNPELVAIDVSDPENPTTIGTLDVNQNSSYNLTVDETNSMLYLPSHDSVSEILTGVSIADPSAMTILSTASISWVNPMAKSSIGKQGNTVLIGDGNGEYTFDVTDPENITPIFSDVPQTSMTFAIAPHLFTNSNLGDYLLMGGRENIYSAFRFDAGEITSEVTPLTLDLGDDGEVTYAKVWTPSIEAGRLFPQFLYVSHYYSSINMFRIEAIDPDL